MSTASLEFAEAEPEIVALGHSTAQRLALSISDTLSDPAWDQFLESVPEGEYQQSCMWAESKVSDGWNCLRGILKAPSGRVAGGFQILHRRKKGIRVGYISRGPVVPKGCHAGNVLSALQTEARKAGISALIIQAPAFDSSLQKGLAEADGFIPGDFGLIQSTMRVDLREGLERAVSRFRRSKRQEISQAQKAGVEVVAGTSTDLRYFFELMLETCARQGSTPNPSSLASLTGLYKAFAVRDRAWLRLAKAKGKIVSGWLALRFGHTLTFFKMGWSGSCPGMHPNSLQIFDLMRLAVEHRLEWCDFAGIDRSLADTLLNAQPFTEQQKQLRDFYKTGFGGSPLLLPQPVIWFAHPALRALYKFSLRFSSNRKLLSSRPATPQRL